VAQGLSEGLGRSIYDKTAGTVEVIPGETVFRPVRVEEPTQEAALTILRGLNASGVTLHKLAPRFDEGDILAQVAFPMAPHEDLQTLTGKLQTAAVSLLEAFFADPAAAWANAHPQEKGEYWPEPDEREMTISPDMTVAEADRILRAFRGVGCYFARADGERIPIREGRVWTAVPATAEGAYALRDGYLEILM